MYVRMHVPSSPKTLHNLHTQTNILRIIFVVRLQLQLHSKLLREIFSTCVSVFRREEHQLQLHN